MEIVKEKAIKFFQSGLNCSQSVFLAYSERFNIDNELALSLSCGFGGGMGRLQETCGAVTASFMIISLFNCNKYHDNNDRKEFTYSMIQDFNEKFILLFGTTNCRSLIKCDLKTSEGRRFAKNNKLFDNICTQCIAGSVTILENMININH
jgi:C_GCAxxG_C_C family probable redox protein